MKKVGALRCAFYSIVAMIICVLVLYFIYKHNKIGRDEAMLVELGILTTGISYNLTKLNEYLKRYADVKAFYNVISFLCICLSTYIYFKNEELFNFFTGITLASILITISLWIKNMRTEIR